MDATKMYPEGFHPIQRDFLPDFSRIVKPLPRSEFTPKYYYTGFDVSVFISSDRVDSETARPEVAAFKVDISDLGTLLRKELFEVRRGYCSKRYRTPTKRHSDSPTSKSFGHLFIRC
jgi:hypothetical protein